MRHTFRKILAVTLAVAMVVQVGVFSKHETSDVQAVDNWKLVWSDEFNGTSLDTSVWSYEIGNGRDGWGNWEVEYYTNRTDNVRVSGGNLQIIAKKENYGGKQYTSGRILTKGKKWFKYGKMVARIKVENGNQNGVWPAYWMMGENMNEGVSWPQCGEIDIMEHANSNNYLGGCLHWNYEGINGSWDKHGSYGSGDAGKDYHFADGDSIENWHEYGLIWDENHMEWQVDGKTYFQQDITDNNAYCFQKAQFFLFNLAIGGTGSGYTNYITADPNTFKTTTMYVDYLRVYQKSNGADQEETTKTPTIPTTTKKQPTTQPVETVTKVSNVYTDLVADTDRVFETYFDGLYGNWGGGVTGSVTNATNKGITIALNKTGNKRWAAQTSIGPLTYYPGYTYKYNATITSDKDRTIVVKVVGNDDGMHDSPKLKDETITVKAGKPYRLSIDVTIPDDYKSELYLYYGLGKGDGDTIGSEQQNIITISDVSFSTTRQVIESETVPRTVPQTINKTTGKVTNPQTTKLLSTTVVKKATKKKNSKKISLRFNRVQGAKKYQVQVAKNKKFTKVIAIKVVNKYKKVTISKKVFKKSKRLYVRVRAIGCNKWSKAKKVKITV